MTTSFDHQIIKLTRIRSFKRMIKLRSSDHQVLWVYSHDSITSFRSSNHQAHSTHSLLRKNDSTWSSDQQDLWALFFETERRVFDHFWQAVFRRRLSRRRKSFYSSQRSWSTHELENTIISKATLRVFENTRQTRGREQHCREISNTNVCCLIITTRREKLTTLFFTILFFSFSTSHFSISHFSFFILTR